MRWTCRPVEKPGATVHSNIEVCLVSCPVTRNASGWPASVTLLHAFGIRTTAFALMVASRFVVRQDGASSSQFGPKVVNQGRNGCKIVPNGSHSAHDNLHIRTVPP